MYSWLVLKRVRVKGFKCLRDVEVDLEPFTVLIGPNDSGKSAFLQAISMPGQVLEAASRSVATGQHFQLPDEAWHVRLDADTTDYVVFDSLPLEERNNAGDASFLVGPPEKAAAVSSGLPGAMGLMDGE